MKQIRTDDADEKRGQICINKACKWFDPKMEENCGGCLNDAPAIISCRRLVTEEDAAELSSHPCEGIADTNRKEVPPPLYAQVIALKEEVSRMRAIAVEREETIERLEHRRGGECRVCGSWVCPPLTCMACLENERRRGGE